MALFCRMSGSNVFNASFPNSLWVGSAGQGERWLEWRGLMSLHFIARLLSFQHGESEQGPWVLQISKCPFHVYTQLAWRLWFPDQKAESLFTAFLIFHHEEMALKGKQSVIQEKLHFMKLRVQGRCSCWGVLKELKTVSCSRRERKSSNHLARSASRSQQIIFT